MIESVGLVNFISHRDTAIQLEDGVNVFIGPNGAGKSSVIDAITYALYGEHTRDTSRNIIRRDAMEGSVSVTFSLASRRYLAERKFGEAGKLETATFRELAPNPRLIVAGERRQFDESMSREVTKAFGLDYEKMKVAAIVQQGELDAIIKYKPKELKELLNSLIGIDKLDSAYGNMRAALDGFRTNLRSECMNYDDQSVGRLIEEIRTTEQKREESGREARRLSGKLRQLELEQATIEAEIAGMEPLRAKKEEFVVRKEELVRYIKKQVVQLGVEEADLAQITQKAREYLPVFASKRLIESEGKAIEYEEQKLEVERPQLAAALRSAKAAEERAREIRGDIRDRLEKVKETGKKIARKRSQIGELRSVELPCKETAEQLRRSQQEAERLAEQLRDEVTRVGGLIDQYEEIRRTGICPTCQSTVAEINLDAKLATKHEEHTEASSRSKAASEQVRSIKELLHKREEYDDAQARLEEQTEQLDDYIEELRSEKEKIASQRGEVKVKSAEARKALALDKKVTLLDSRLSELRARKNSFRGKHSALILAEAWLAERQIANTADAERWEKKLAAIRARIQSIPKDPSRSETKDLAIDDASRELVNRIESLEREVSRFDEASYERTKRRLEDEIRPDVRRLTTDIGGLKRRADDAIEHVSKLEEAKARIEAATSYVKLFERIRADVYNRDGILATSLRSWALKELSRSASNYIRSFGIGLSELQLKEQRHDVNIECYSASGKADVKSMSGGEGVAIALSLRFAMAGLMGKGMVDFIVLDEPTTHLDEQRRRSLVRLVTEFNSDENQSPLNQIIVITHDREIFEDSEVNAVFQFQKSEDATIVTKS